jgi:hypothetical protein
MNIYNKTQILISNTIKLSNDEVSKAFTNNSTVCKFYKTDELLELNDKCMYEKLCEEDYDYMHPCFDLDDKKNDYEENIKKEIANILFNYLIPNFFIYVSQKDRNIKLMKYEGELKEDSILSLIKTNVAITISNDPHKLSVHANYPNIILTRVHMEYIIKNHFEKWLASLSSDIKYYQYKRYLLFIDIGIYKKNMSLRAINSFKEDGSGRLNIFSNNNKLDHYFSYINLNPDNIIINKVKEVQKLNPIINSSKSEIVENEESILEYIQQVIKNPCNISSPISYDSYHTITVQYKEECALCGKDMHKNKHMFICNNDGRITILKSGNKNSCKTHTAILEFEKSSFDLTSQCIDYILSLDILYKTTKNIYIGWNGLKWCILDVKDKTETEYTITKFIFELKNKIPDEYFSLINKMDSKTINLINRIKLSIPTKSINRYEQSLFIAFNNGVYNISTGNFIQGMAAKKFMLYETIDRDYNEAVNQAIEEELISLINKIQPDIDDNIENKIRFEKCLASTIVFRCKRIVYAFIGMTKSGKSTIKSLLLTTLGDSLADKCDANAFLDTSTSGPKHDLANISNKTFIGISELKQGFKLHSQAIKKLTEPTIAARKNFSTETSNQINNVATFIFDCNSVIDFTEHTPSVYERVCTLFFNSRFITSDKEHDIIGDDRLCFQGDPDLEHKILSGIYTDYFFRYLTSLYRKHFKNEFRLEAYCHSSIPIAQTMEICNRELLNTICISEEFTKLLLENNYGRNLKFTMHDDRLRIMVDKHTLAKQLVSKYEDIAKIENDKYKNLIQYNISSFFSEMGAIKNVLVISRDDYEIIMKNENISDEIKIKEREYLNNALLRLKK